MMFHSTTGLTTDCDTASCFASFLDLMANIEESNRPPKEGEIISPTLLDFHCIPKMSSNRLTCDASKEISVFVLSVHFQLLTNVSPQVWVMFRMTHEHCSRAVKVLHGMPELVAADLSWYCRRSA
ncbi:unnamed protein product [Prorocentrum cordatum]|uniref:Uncharacterized protein n=1 Tax=Prorocentrum cordatum TaxID=2364126 RepID=A0ABN9SGU0_9DINO|nr:unnamed protein product [Polarella glacialis]